MKRYELNKNYDVLVEKAGEYYAETLIDYLLEEENIKLGWDKIEGISNDWISYRVVKKNNKITKKEIFIELALESKDRISTDFYNYSIIQGFIKTPDTEIIEIENKKELNDLLKYVKKDARKIKKEYGVFIKNADIRIYEVGKDEPIDIIELKI